MYPEYLVAKLGLVSTQVTSHIARRDRASGSFTRLAQNASRLVRIGRPILLWLFVGCAYTFNFSDDPHRRKLIMFRCRNMWTRWKTEIKFPSCTVDSQRLDREERGCAVRAHSWDNRANTLNPAFDAKETRLSGMDSIAEGWKSLVIFHVVGI